jgi:FSR family fosmidomycin resistance protein-like MFS transporter
MDAKTAEMGVVAAPITQAPAASAAGPVYGIIAAISLCHALNDLMQSLVPSLYPVLKSAYALDFGQVGLIQLVFMLTASVLQPFVGIYTDRRPLPFSLPMGMLLTLVGLVSLAYASSYPTVLLAAALIGMGSAVFHPESSRVARMASGGRHGTAQSLFQVGGNVGSAVGPLLAAFIVVPRGQTSVAWFALVALVGMTILAYVGRWYGARLRAPRAARASGGGTHSLSRGRVTAAMVLLVVLIFSKYVYMSSLSSYYTFYLIHHFGMSVPNSQLCLFVFLGSVALGTVAGGPIGDRFGRKVVIWASILGVLPFTLALPYANLAGTIALTIPIGLILASAMPQIVVFAQELMPGRIGLVSGLFLGFAFGFGGIGAAILGELADHTSIEFVYRVVAFLPAIGLVAAFLPNMDKLRPR